jgi:hypothetical protein
MAEVQLLDIGEIEQEVFTSWDITGYQVTRRHLLSSALTGTDGVVWDHAMFPPGFVHHTHRHRTLTCREPPSTYHPDVSLSSRGGTASDQQREQCR